MLSCNCFIVNPFILKLLPQTWHSQINLHDFSYENIFRAMSCVEIISRRSKNQKYTCKTSTLLCCYVTFVVIVFRRNILWENIYKNTHEVLWIQVWNVKIEELFFSKSKTSRNKKKKAVVPFLPRNPKLEKAIKHFQTTTMNNDDRQ